MNMPFGIDINTFVKVGQEEEKKLEKKERQLKSKISQQQLVSSLIGQQPQAAPGEQNAE